MSLTLLAKLKLQFGFIKKTLLCSKVLIYYNMFFQVIFSPLPVHSWLSSAHYRGTMLSSILPNGSSGVNMHYRKIWFPMQETRCGLWLTNRLYYLLHIIQEKIPFKSFLDSTIFKDFHVCLDLINSLSHLEMRFLYRSFFLSHEIFVLQGVCIEGVYMYF